MKHRIINILMALSAMTALVSCSTGMDKEPSHDMSESSDSRSIIITGAVTDAHDAYPLEDITIHFQAYPQDAPDASPIMTDEVYTTSNGTFTIHENVETYKSLLCVLTASDPDNIYASQTKQVIVTWGGTSYDKKSGTFVVNDCIFHLNKTE